MHVTRDADGDKLRADRRYRIHFDADNMPPVDLFWSLGMYGTDLNLVANPINRYSIGDRTAGLSTDADGGLTIWRRFVTHEVSIVPSTPLKVKPTVPTRSAHAGDHTFIPSA